MIDVLEGGRPGDVRGFLHKKVFGALKAGFAGIKGIAGSLVESQLGFGGGRTAFSPCPAGTPGCGPQPQLLLPPGVPQKRCTDPRLVWDPELGACVFPGSPLGRSRGFGDEFGEAVIGQFGSGIQPAFRDTTTRICPRGAVLGSDGICYNRKEIRNSDRAWPRGRAPLLTGGEMRAISIASRAAGKLERKQKQLRRMGMLPALPKARKVKALPAGHHAHVAHN